MKNSDTISKPPFFHVDVLMIMYFSILLGYLASYINCDLQRMMSKNPFAIHLLGFMGMVFIYITSNSQLSTQEVLIRSLGMYLMFVLTTKSKWYFGLSVLALLLIYGVVRRHYLRENDEEYLDQLPVHQERILSLIRLLIGVLMVIGLVHYVVLQSQEYKDKFSWTKFLIGTGSCKKLD